MKDENSGLIPVGDHELFMATTARGYEPGQIVFGRFVLTRVLGRGGMGIVWLAHDNQLEQDVAIKVLPDVVMHDREAVGDMKRETKRSLQLNHHNIVRIYDFNQDEKGAGISMEFVDGETLSAAKAGRPGNCFNTEEVGPWLEQICEALAYAHQTAKIVHRDLKPANIMLTKGGVIKVTDFGIARSISDSVSRLSLRFASSGTMAYMSPQQSCGARSAASDDIYALGATIYDLLTGKPPFYSGNIQHQLESITPPSMAERRLELERHGSPIPEAWEKTVASCLEKEPGKRPASVHELAKLLNLAITTPVSVVPAHVVSAPATNASNRVATDETPSTVSTPGTQTAPPTPKPPAKPWLPPGLITPARLKIAGIAAGVIVLLVAIPMLIAYIIGKGTLIVDTSPAGAVLTVDGDSLSSPATFNNLWSGKKTVQVELEGYDPVQVTAEIAKDKKTDLGVIPLTRSTGTLAITSVPRRATSMLEKDGPPQSSDASGPIADSDQPAPTRSTPIGTGGYNVVTTADGFPDHTQHLDLKRGDNQQIFIDLVKDNAISSLSPDEAAAVNAGQPIPDKLRQDPAAKTALTSYYRDTFQRYLGVNELKLAAQQLQRLTSDLGVTTTDEQRQLTEAQQQLLADTKSNFNELLQKNRFDAAQNLLDEADAEGIPSTGEQREALTQARTAYDQKIEKTLNDIDTLENSGQQPQAYQAALAALAKEGQGIPLLKRVATLELPMPSTYERVSTRVKSMNDALVDDPTLSKDVEFTQLLATFQKNLDIHNEYRTKMAPLEDQVASFDSQIDSLRGEQAHDRKKAQGYGVMSILGMMGSVGSAAAGSDNGTAAGGLVSSVGQNGAAARSADIQQLQGEIGDLESQREGPAGQLDDLRKQYDALQAAPINTVQ